MTKPSQRAVSLTTPNAGNAPAASAVAHAWAQVGAALSPHPDCPLPNWTGGGDTLHQHLLVIGNEHDSDLVSQLRHLEVASARFGKVGFVCPAKTRRLIEWSMGERVVVLSRMPRDVSDWDMRCALASLARTLGPQAANAHAGRPFLRVAAVPARHWRDRLAAAAQRGFCVGLAGLDAIDSTELTSTSASASGLTSLAPLLRVPGVSWVPLGQEEDGVCKAMPPESVDWIDWRTDCDDLADEASLIDNLDLVIALDAEHAHLAEGLGVPVCYLGAPRTSRLAAAHHDDRYDAHFSAERLSYFADTDDFRLPPVSQDWPRTVDTAAKALLAMATEFQGWTR
ncbi:hypothetical protein [Pandoraea oxalativorans]|uniref:Glycosyl transferase family 8 n=1 Tax=Pandoraea oxalativorans TaxID=573737 RepID=A0A0E3YFZ9_9BURK|nr:hypothetical protein [Pandoraea oxalativorans]AKC71421.1 hypothetical protein MB84_21090 [Pandoraea oxalativorans]